MDQSSNNLLNGFDKSFKYSNLTESTLIMDNNSIHENKKMKMYEVNDKNMEDVKGYSKKPSMLNNNKEIENNLIFSSNTRLINNNISERDRNDQTLLNPSEQINMPINDNNINYIKNEISDKDFEKLWDNTKRRNLKTDIYTPNAMKVGRGVGVVNNYDKFKNYIGEPTRQSNVENNPRNIDYDRLYPPMHNYNYTKNHVYPENPGGRDTRYLNKKMT
jgi:hypothetical protein